MRIPLIGGAYQARSVIANAQRCVNLFPEANPKDSTVPVTHYGRPGLRKLVAPPEPGAGRGVFRASNGKGFCVCGTKVYAIGADWSLTKIGDIESQTSTPCYFADNGADGLLVDGSPNGYQINIKTGEFKQFSDPNGLFTGADRIDYMDTFLIWNVPDGNQWASTLSNTLETDGLYFAKKTVWPDPIKALICNRHELIIVGELKTEIWYNAGNETFPFALLPGAYHEHGTASTYSVAAEDINVYWLSQDLQGARMVLLAKGYEVQRISNHALEWQLTQLPWDQIANAVGYCYQQGGHVFYLLTAGDQTWVFDSSTKEWHQRSWMDGEGRLHRDRGNGHAFLAGENVVIDWENGTLYALDPNHYVDSVNNINCPIPRIRTFPHIESGMGPQGPFPLDGRRVHYARFMADMESGTLPENVDGSPANVILRVSTNRGRTFGNAPLQSLGSPGHYETYPQWNQIGMSRDMVFELEWSGEGPCALNGAWVQIDVPPQTS